MLEKLLYATGPVIFVLLAEHIVLKHFYGKKTSIERLCRSVTESAKSDWLMALFYYVAFKFPLIRSVVSLITLPGLAYMALKYLEPYIQWPGMVSGYLPDSVVANIVIWLVLYDLTHYISHVLMHKSGWLWRMHKLHHAATEFTILTGVRISPSEHFFNSLVSFAILVMLLGMPRPEIFYVVVFIRRVVDLIQHSDLPWDYGLFGYLVASPRFHRLHHSNHPQDYDSNYGDVFAFWDHLFGTVSKRYRRSPVLADSCDLGLETETESSKFNRWKTALFHETLLQYAWSLFRAVRAPRGLP